MPSKITRRRFVKICVLGMAGFFIAKLTGDPTQRTPGSGNLKEASFYRRADDLAG